jgi:hypothetical protein
MKCLQERLGECAEAPDASVLNPPSISIVRRIATFLVVGVIGSASTVGVKAQRHSMAGRASRCLNEIGQTVAGKPADSSTEERKETINTSALIEGVRRMRETIELLNRLKNLERRLGESRTAVNTADGSSGANRTSLEASSSATSGEDPASVQNELRAATPSSTDSGQNAASSKPSWHYGGFVDVGYLLDFNHPSNHLFRSRGTTFHVDNLFVNMAGVYAKKAASEQSRWGAEFTAQGGKDSELFGFSATVPNIGGFEVLSHLGPTNVSYLAPVGKGLTVQGGIFGSLIGYDSLYAKDNFNYTRPWGADFTPYLMMGVNASYPFNDKLTGAIFVINGYWHLANANSVPSSGGQLAYKATTHVTVKETVLWGPHQTDTSLKYWRSLSDTIVERKGDRVTFAFEYMYSSERVVAPGNSRALMMASQLPIHWTINKRWSATVRPEVFWDRDGRWTLARQTVKAITTTLEYRIPYKETNTILRVEHRWDDSRGPDGGFFRGGEVLPGVPGLTPTQHLLTFGLIFTFDH